jgi:hypothetical protein
MIPTGIAGIAIWLLICFAIIYVLKLAAGALNINIPAEVEKLVWVIFVVVVAIAVIKLLVGLG